MKTWHAIEIEMDRIAETAVTTQLWAANTTGIEISEDTPSSITLRAYFEELPNLEKITEQIQYGLQLCDSPQTALRTIRALTIDEQDWLAEWKKGYEPIEIGNRILIVPSWKRDEIPPTDRIKIQIDPGMAFGTGTHETTRGCLVLLEKYWRGGALLDVGTGTGILAMAALKLAPGSRVVGFDIDPEAIEVAIENAEINGVADELQLEVDKLSTYQDRDFDVVLANLTADVIIPLAPEFPRALKTNGILIVSGILREQGEEVIATLAQHRFSLNESIPDGEWVTFAFSVNA